MNPIKVHFGEIKEEWLPSGKKREIPKTIYGTAVDRITCNIQGVEMPAFIIALHDGTFTVKPICDCMHDMTEPPKQHDYGRRDNRNRTSFESLAT